MREFRSNITERVGVTVCNLAVATNIRRLALGLSLIALSSCALMKSDGSARETYDLTAPTKISGVRGASRSQILVKNPTALKSLDSNRIIVRPSATVITYLAGAQWSDTVPNLIQAKLVEAFENSGATRATARPGDGLIIDYQLVSDIRKFEISDGVAVIELSIKLLRDRSGLVRETRIFKASTRAGGKEAADIVAAFDASFDTIAREIVMWVAKRT
jgi:cholesterol transport system auxiliary component